MSRFDAFAQSLFRMCIFGLPLAIIGTLIACAISVRVGALTVECFLGLWACIDWIVTLAGLLRGFTQPLEIERRWWHEGCIGGAIRTLMRAFAMYLLDLPDEANTLSHAASASAAAAVAMFSGELSVERAGFWTQLHCFAGRREVLMTLPLLLPQFITRLLMVLHARLGPDTSEAYCMSLAQVGLVYSMVTPFLLQVAALVQPPMAIQRRQDGSQLPIVRSLSEDQQRVLSPVRKPELDGNVDMSY